MSPCQLALATGVCRYDLEDTREELSDEQWELYCEELMMLAYSPD